MDSMMVQMVTTPSANSAAQTTGNQASRGQSADNSDFGSMVRQKTQDARGQDTQKTQKNQKNQDSDSDQSAQTQQGAKADGKAKTEVTTEQYVIAAALMFQPEMQLLELLTASEAAPVEQEVRQEVQVVEASVTAPEVPQERDEAAPEEELSLDLSDDRPEETFQAVVERTGTETVEEVEVVEEEETEETVETVEIAPEQQVFTQVEAVPVKVAEPVAEEPVDLTQPEDVERMAARIDRLVVSEEGESKVEFTLVPASLGKITVEIVRTQDGALHIQLSATTTRAAELLGRNSDNLQYLLGINSRPAVHLSLPETDETVRQLLNPDGHQQEQQRQQQRRQKKEDDDRDPHDFLQQLRLGLTGVSVL